MLTTIRERAQGWIAWVIVFIISVPFALWGINEYFGAQEKVVIAEINGNELLSQDFQELIQRQRVKLRQQFGGKIDNKIFESMPFKMRVLNEMITQRLVTADIRDQNYQIGDEQLASYLRSNPMFQAEGVFSPELYTQAVRRNGFTTTAYENQMRLGSMVSQIKDGFTRSVINAEEEVDNLLRLQQEKRDFRTIILPALRFADQVDITDSDIKEYYDAARQQFMTDEVVRVEYISLSLQGIADQVQPDEEALQTYYNETKDQYIQPEQRQAQHILLAVDAEAEEQEEAKVRQLANELAEQARQENSDFAELAKKYSVDTISSANGGDLGYFEKGVMDESFDKKVFAMLEGEISDPVRSRFGFHIIKLNSIQPQSGKSFAQARDQVLKEYSLREATARFGQMAEELHNLVYEQPTTLQPAADALGLTITSSDWFSRAGGDDEITAARPFIDSAFTEDVLLEGLNSEVVETSPDTLVALRLLEHRKPQQKPLEDVAEEIKQVLRKQQSQQKVAREVEEIIKSLKSAEQQLEQFAEQKGVELSAYDNVPRSGKDDLPGKLVNAVFHAPVNKASAENAVGSVQLANGDYAVFSISKVAPGDPRQVPEEVRDQIRAVLQERKGAGLFSDYERGLYENAEITIFEENL